MLGGLYRYLREADPKHFQPMNANFGLLEPLAGQGEEGPEEGAAGGAGAGGFRCLARPGPVSRARSVLPW